VAGLATGYKEALAQNLVLSWGVQLTPLLALHFINLRMGVRSAQGQLACRVLTSGCQITNQQLRYQGLSMWCANSGEPVEVPAQGGNKMHSYMLAPLCSRALAGNSFARDRRRAMMGIHWRRMGNGDEATGVVRQLLLKPLNLYMLLRAADYSMFLLTK
jgi:hypothetical protein